MPNVNLQTSPQVAPDYAHYRQIKEATDALPEIIKQHGINMAHYRTMHIQVAPSDGADPTIAVFWWSDALQKFVQEHTPISKVGKGANVPFEFTAECRGRIAFIAVTAGVAAGQTVDIYVAGYNLDHSL